MPKADGALKRDGVVPRARQASALTERDTRAAAPRDEGGKGPEQQQLVYILCAFSAYSSHLHDGQIQHQLASDKRRKIYGSHLEQST